jgi:hypothetical protein
LDSQVPEPASNNHDDCQTISAKKTQSIIATFDLKLQYNYRFCSYIKFKGFGGFSL